MIKLKFPLITLFISIAFITVGYASWGETNELGSTVRTGELDLKYESMPNSNIVRSSEYVETNVDITDEEAHEAKITLSNLYPGAWTMFKLKVLNSGTIPAKLENAEMEFEGDTNLLKYLFYDAGISIDKNGDSIIDWNVDFNGILTEFEKDFNKEILYLDKAYLEANNSGKLFLGRSNSQIKDYIKIKFDESAPEDTQNKSVTFNLRLNFKQYSY
ncbi:MAG: hypothetical protein ABF289_02090 [Clostridiales bacterium]